MADNTEKLVTLSNLSDHIEEIKRILKQVRAFIDKKDDTKVDKVDGKGLSSNDYTAAEKNKLATLKNYDDSTLVAQVKALEQSLNTLVGNNASEAIDNFNEILKFLSGISDTQTLEGMLANIRSDMQTYLSQKVDKVSGKQLSTNDYTTAEKNKLAGIEAGAQKNTVTGIKGNAESSYRTGNVNLTPANVGAAAASHKHPIADVTDLQATLDGKAAKSHTHSASEITDFTTKVKTLQAADILSAEPTESTTTHTVNGVSVAYQIGELVRVPDSESETGYKFYQLHAITDGKAMWAEIGTGGGSNIVYSYITIDQGQSGESAMISGDISGEAIRAIRVNSHIYLGKQTASGKQLICQLNDSNGTQYADGTTAALDGTEGDQWLRLPEFYWKRVSVIGERTTYGFAFGGQPDATWKKWDSRQLLGVHEAYVASSKLYSRSGVKSGGSLTRDTFKTYARNRGTGYTCVTWEWHCMMAMLFYAFYGRMNSQEQCGSGSASHSRTLGTKDSLGMTDTTSSNGNADNTKFWGIENWWGDKYEWIDNADVNGYAWTITNVENGSTRSAGTATSSAGWIVKTMLSENMDLIPTSTGGSDTTYFCDSYFCDSGVRVVLRSCDSANTNGGVACVGARTDSSVSAEHIGSRLAFIGEIEEAGSVAAYKAASSIG